METIGSTKNSITYKKGLEEKKIDQKISLTKNNPCMFSFTTELDTIDDSGETKTQKPTILNVEKTNGDKYIVRIKSPELFKSNENEGIESLGLKKDGDDFILEIDSTQPAISIEKTKTSTAISKKSGEELIIEIASTDGKKYKISAGSTEISFEYGTENEKKLFSYKPDLENGKAISSTIDSSAIEAFLDNESIVFNTPDAKSIKSNFPSYLIGLYASNMNNDESRKFGDFTITKLSTTGGKTATPYVFVTHNDADEGKETSYIYVRGKLQKCENSLCLYDKEEDGSLSYHVLIPGRKGIYYGIPLPKNNKNELTSRSQALLSFITEHTADISSEAGQTNKKSKKNSPLTVNLSKHDKEVVFYKKDDRSYVSTTFAINKTSSTYEEVDPQEIIAEIPASIIESSQENFISNQTIIESELKSLENEEIEVEPEFIGLPDENEEPSHEENNESEGDSPVIIDGEFEEIKNQPSEGKPASEKPQVKEKAAKQPPKEKEKKEEPEEEEKKIDISKPVEAFGQFSTYAGIFVFAAAALTGPLGAILAPVGLALAGSGFLATNFADVFKFSYFKKAKNKVKEYEALNFERYSFTEHFIETENNIEQMVENAREQELELASLFEQGSQLQDFMEIYDKYGVGFSADKEIAGNGFSRTAMLCGYKGLSVRQNMASQLNSISSVSETSQRNKLIDSFMQTHFHFMPKEAKKKLSQLFDFHNQPQMTKLIEEMQKTNEIHAKIKLKRDSQIKTLAGCSDSEIERIICSKKFDASSRERFLTAYAPALLRNHIGNRKGDAKISHILEAVPSHERAAAVEIFKTASNRMQEKINYTKALAEENQKLIDFLEDARTYNSVLENINSKNNLASTKDILEATRKYVLTHDNEFYHGGEYVEMLENFKIKPENITTLSQKSKNVESMMYTVTEKNIKSGNKILQNAWIDLYNSLIQDEKGQSILSDIAEQKRFTSIKKSKTLDYKDTIVEYLKTRAKYYPELQAKIEHFEKCKVQSTELFSTTIPSILYTIEQELDEYGIEPENAEIKKFEKKISAEIVESKHTVSTTKRRLAFIQASINQKINEIPKKNPTQEDLQLRLHLTKVEKFVKQIASGDLAQAKYYFNMTEAIKAADKTIVHENGALTKAEIQLKKEFEGKNTFETIINNIHQKDKQKQVKERYLKLISEGKDEKTAVKEALENIVGQQKDEKLLLSIDELIKKHSDKKGTNLSQLSKEIDILIDNLDYQTSIELTALQADMGEHFARAEYEEQCRMLGKTPKTKKQELTVEELEKLLEPVNNAENLKIKIEEIKAKFEVNDYVDAAFLMAEIEKSEIKTLLKEIDIDSNEIIEIINRSNDYAVVSRDLEHFEKTHLLFKKLDQSIDKAILKASRTAKAEIIGAEEKGWLNKDETGKELIEAENVLKEHKEDSRELITKLEFITTHLEDSGYSQATIVDFVTAFATGNEKFFIDHKIQLQEPYFFSDQDKKLLKKFGIKPKFLISTVKKKGASTLLEKTKIKLETITNEKLKKVQTLQSANKDTSGEEQRLSRKQLRHMEQRLLLTSKIIDSEEKILENMTIFDDTYENHKNNHVEKEDDQNLFS